MKKPAFLRAFGLYWMLLLGQMVEAATTTL